MSYYQNMEKNIDEFVELYKIYNEKSIIETGKSNEQLLKLLIKKFCYITENNYISDINIRIDDFIINNIDKFDESCYNDIFKYGCYNNSMEIIKLFEKKENINEIISNDNFENIKHISSKEIMKYFLDIYHDTGLVELPINEIFCSACGSSYEEIIKCLADEFDIISMIEYDYYESIRRSISSENIDNINYLFSKININSDNHLDIWDIFEYSIYTFNINIIELIWRKLEPYFLPLSYKTIRYVIVHNKLDILKFITKKYKFESQNLDLDVDLNDIIKNGYFEMYKFLRDELKLSFPDHIITIQNLKIIIKSKNIEFFKYILRFIEDPSELVSIDDLVCLFDDCVEDETNYNIGILFYDIFKTNIDKHKLSNKEQKTWKLLSYKNIFVAKKAVKWEQVHNEVKPAAKLYNMFYDKLAEKNEKIEKMQEQLSLIKKVLN